jgi:hypothetical protein
MDEEVAKFWREFEADTGETVEAKAVGEVYLDNRETGVWCLLILTDRSFWFKQVPSNNWVASLFTVRTLAPSSKRSDEFTITVPRGSLLALEEPQRKSRGWFSKPTFPLFTLAWRDGQAVRNRRFSIDPSSDLLPRLRALFKDSSART